MIETISQTETYKQEIDIQQNNETVVFNIGHTIDIAKTMGEDFNPDWYIQLENEELPFSRIPLESLTKKSHESVSMATKVLNELYNEISQINIKNGLDLANRMLDKQKMLDKVDGLLNIADYELTKMDALSNATRSFIASLKDQLEEFRQDPDFEFRLTHTLTSLDAIKMNMTKTREAIAETRGRIDPEFALTFRLYYAGPLGERNQAYPEDSWVYRDVLNVDLENFARIEADEMVDREGDKIIPWSYDRKMIFILENLTIGEGRCQVIETEAQLEVPDPEEIGLTGRDINDFKGAVQYLQGLTNSPFIILDGFEDEHGSPIDLTGRRGWRKAMGNLFGTDEFKDFYSQNKLKWNSFLYFLNGLNILTLLVESPALSSMADYIYTLFAEASSVTERDYSLLPTLPPEGTQPTPDNSKIGFMEHYDQECRKLMRQFSELAQQKAA